jgi:hypothetical protein
LSWMPKLGWFLPTNLSPEQLKATEPPSKEAALRLKRVMEQREQREWEAREQAYQDRHGRPMYNVPCAPGMVGMDVTGHRWDENGRRTCIPKNYSWDEYRVISDKELQARAEVAALKEYQRRHGIGRGGWL